MYRGSLPPPPLPLIEISVTIRFVPLILSESNCAPFHNILNAALHVSMCFVYLSELLLGVYPSSGYIYVYDYVCMHVSMCT